MKHFASTRFWQRFHLLPIPIQHLARRQYALLKQDPTHPSLHFKAVHGGQGRSVRIGMHHRALGIPVPDGIQWFWIGTHAEYDKMLT